MQARAPCLAAGPAWLTEHRWFVVLVCEPWGRRIVTPLVLGLSVNVEIFFFFLV